ncbi:protein mono-ADP-ribosyltransferase PARP14-like isoform X2 [Haliotis asinina]|uniref:protein mono-ADP-ribosyltransferase PARP14-like isoform X2 n=1 Tax=Haliotis asinina TaxID=109174 RepID=UPI0035326742
MESSGNHPGYRGSQMQPNRTDLPMPHPPADYPYSGTCTAMMEGKEYQGAGTGQMHHTTQQMQFSYQMPQPEYGYPHGRYPPLQPFCYCGNIPEHHHPDYRVYVPYPPMPHTAYNQQSTQPHPVSTDKDYGQGGAGLYYRTPPGIATVPNAMGGTFSAQYDGQTQQTHSGTHNAQSYQHPQAQAEGGPGISNTWQDMGNQSPRHPEYHPSIDPETSNQQPSSNARSGHLSTASQGETPPIASGPPWIQQSNPVPQLGLKPHSSSSPNPAVKQRSEDETDSSARDSVNDLTEGLEKLNVNDDMRVGRNMTTNGTNRSEDPRKLSIFEGAGTRRVTTEYYLDRFLLSGLKTSILEETLWDYVEVISECGVKSVEYTLDGTCAVVTVDQNPDWDSLAKKVKKRRLEKEMVEIHKIALTQSICVHGICSRNEEDLFVNYFENKKSGNKGWKVTNTEIRDNLVVVTFECSEAVDAVLSQPVHRFSGKTWQVGIFYSDIGCVQERSKMVNTEWISDMLLGEVKLMKVTGFLDSLKTDHRHLQEVSVEGDTTVKLKGTVSDVSTTKVKIRQFQQEIKRMNISCSAAKRKYLESECVKSYIPKALVQKDIKSAWSCDKNSVDIFALSDRDLKTTELWIRKHIKEQQFTVPHMTSPEFDEKIKSLRQNLDDEYPPGSYTFDVCGNTRCIDVVAQHEYSYRVFEAVADWFPKPVPDKNTHLTFPKDKFRFIQKHMKDKVLQMMSEYRVHLEFKETECQLEIKGEGEMLQKAKAFFDESGLRNEILALGPAESEDLLKSGHLQCLEAYVERTERCTISDKVTGGIHSKDMHAVMEASGAAGGYREPGDREDYGNHIAQRHAHDQEPQSSNSSFYLPSPDMQDNNGANGGNWEHAKKKSKRADRKFVTSSRLRIILKTGELAKEKVDVLINTVGKGMAWKSGALSKSVVEAGGKKLLEECEKRKDLKEGDYTVTSGGKLLCKHVFHCCLPPASDVTAGQRLEDLIISMLKYANVLKASSVSFPALGTGGLGYQPAVVANSMYKTVQEYGKAVPSSSIQEVRFVIFPSKMDIFKAFEFVDKQIKSSNAAQPGRSPKRPGHFPMICIAEIAQQKVDIIVNTSNRYLDLSRGAVSKSLVQYGGASIQKECNAYIARKMLLLERDFAVTTGGHLSCNRIYHCNLPSYTPYGKWLMKDMIMTMLESADKYKNTSIAFPALGTGNLGYPREEVAKIMFSTVADFWKRYPRTRLEDVRFVLHKGDEKTIKAFQDEEKLRGSLDPPLVPPRSSKPAHLTKNSGGKKAPTHQPVVFHMAPVKVVVKQGNIAEEKADAIINPISSDMNLNKGSVSRALRQVGGSEFEEKTKDTRNRLQVKRVSNVLMNTGVRVCHVDREIVRQNQLQAILTCLKNSETMNDEIVAFPILQTGDVSEEMAQDLHKALRRFLKPSQNTKMKEVHVVIHDPRYFDKFSKTFGKLCEDQGTEKQDSHQQVTFTLWSDKRECFENAKRKLKQFCIKEDMKTYMKVPESISKDDISTVGREYPDVKVCVSPDGNEIELKGKPKMLLDALDAFHKQFQRKCDEWQHHVNEEVETKLQFQANPPGIHSATNSYDNNLSNLPCNSKETVSYTKNLFPNQQYSHPSTISGHETWENTPGSAMERTTVHQWRPEMHKTDPASWNTKPTPLEGATGNSQTEDDRHDHDSYLEKRHDDCTSRSLKTCVQSANKMKWYFLDPSLEELVAYDDRINEDIEQSYLRGCNHHGLPFDEQSDTEFTINFKTMEEYPENDLSDKVEVLRREVIDTGGCLPSTWCPMKKRVEVVCLKPADPAYELVKNNIKQSCRHLDVSVLKVERVQNEELHGRYLAKKNSLASPDEKSLWYHCNLTDSIDPISKYGVNLNFCRKKHEPFGEGIYLSDFDQNATTNTHGSQYAFLCHVLVGVPAKGRLSLRDPPSRPPDNSSFYDSVVDSVENPSTYVIFSDAQVYPEYLVTYKINKE